MGLGSHPDPWGDTLPSQGLHVAGPRVPTRVPRAPAPAPPRGGTPVPAAGTSGGEEVPEGTAPVGRGAPRGNSRSLQRGGRGESPGRNSRPRPARAAAYTSRRAPRPLPVGAFRRGGSGAACGGMEAVPRMPMIWLDLKEAGDFAFPQPVKKVRRAAAGQLMGPGKGLGARSGMGEGLRGQLMGIGGS